MSGLSFWLSTAITYTHASRDSVTALCGKKIRRKWNRLYYSKEKDVNCVKCAARISEASTGPGDLNG